MKTLVFFLFFLFPIIITAQTITTIAGNGLSSDTGDGGPASAASTSFPCYGVFDRFGNYYYCNSSVGNSVRKISPSGIITTVAGGGSGSSGDGGPATLAQLDAPQGVAVDTFGNIYIGEHNGHRIRKVTVATGNISTIAGTGIHGYSGDNGPATAAEIYGPIGIWMDLFGNLYIADYGNNVVRKINSSGIITTVVGGGITPYTTSGVQATSVSLGAWDVCTDKEGNLYIADGTRWVCKINSLGIVTTLVGNGTSGHSGDGGAATAAETVATCVRVDEYGNIIISEYSYNFIRMVNHSGNISTISGNGHSGYSGDNGPATMALLNYPAGLALDACDNVYITDSRNNRIRKITYPKCNYLSVTDLVNQVEAFEIYPNPVRELLNINNVSTACHFRIFTVLGLEVLNGVIKKGDNSVLLGSLKAGVYLLEVIEGSQVLRNTIIKE